jgi:methyltransferase (TIGR00027 family)
MEVREPAGTVDRPVFKNLAAVSNTALLTLWARAIEARSADPILSDPTAIALTQELRPQLAAIASPFYQQLLADQVPSLLTLLMALRARFFDQKAINFLSRFPNSIIVNLGAGLDTRFERLTGDTTPVDGTPRVIDIDLPAMIALKRELLASHPRHEFVAVSVLDHSWMDALDRYDGRRFIFLAEGLLMYLPPAEVKRLVVALANRFPGSEFVADVFNALWLRPPWREWVNYKMQRQFHFEEGATFQFGLDSPNEMEQWHPLIHFQEAWSFFDADERKLGLMRWARHIPLLRLVQYIVRYHLG